jgi:hypothetical protein
MGSLKKEKEKEKSRNTCSYRQSDRAVVLQPECLPRHTNWNAWHVRVNTRMTLIQSQWHTVMNFYAAAQTTDLMILH